MREGTVWRPSLGIRHRHSVPLPMAYVVAAAEMRGAIGVILGVLTPVAAGGIMLLMLATMALHIVEWHSPYWASSGGWEYDLFVAGRIVEGRLYE
nr:DoxX family protein [Nocardia nova]